MTYYAKISLVFLFIFSVSGRIIFSDPKDATITDVDWSSMSGLPGVDMIVSDIAIDPSGKVYIGGLFTVAGTVTANNIAMWDGNAWCALGKGLNYRVNAIALDSSGNLYAGGEFDSSGDVCTRRIARWDGHAWSQLGSGMSGRVYALAMDKINGKLYAGGEFDSAGGIFVSHIAVWNGNFWNALGSGINAPSYDPDYCYALTIDKSGNLYAGGTFDSIGNIAANNIAQWNGSSWSPLGTGVDRYKPQNTSVVCGALFVDHTGTLWAGGSFMTAGGLPVNHIARWDGTIWSAAGNGISSKYSMVHSISEDSSGIIWVCGHFDTKYDSTAGTIIEGHIAKWNGSSWTSFNKGIKTPNSINSIKFNSMGALYVGGSFNSVENVSVSGVARYYSGVWSALGEGINDGVRAICVDRKDNLFAGGSFTSIGGTNANRIARWDGSSWTALGKGIRSIDNQCIINAIVVDRAGNLFVKGLFDTAGEVAANNIAKWDGSTWSALGMGLYENPEIPRFWESMAVDSSGNLYTSGRLDNAGNNKVYGIVRWNGTGWNNLGEVRNGLVHAITVNKSGDLYAGGTFDTIDGVPTRYIAKWDGNTWSGLSSELKGWGGVHALVIDNDSNLYAGGEFDSAGGIKVNNVAKWNGSCWSSLGSGIDHVIDFDMDMWGVFALTIDKSGNLYAGGDFDTAGGIHVNQLAKWNGTEWSPLGSGIGSYYYGVQSMVVDSRSKNLYISGNFLTAGGIVSPHIAKCNIGGPEESQIPAKSYSKRKESTPYHTSDLIRFTLNRPAVVKYFIFTLQGRQVYNSVQTLPAGNSVLRLNMCNIPKGVYIVQATTDVESLRWRVVK